MKKPPRVAPAVLAPGWPNTPADTPEVEKARQLALNVRAVMADRSIRAIAKEADIDEATLRRVLTGAVWPDLLTIARLEETLGVDLYPRSSSTKE